MKKTMVVTIMAAAMALGMGLSVNAAPNADDMEFTVCELEESVETAAEEATADITIADASNEDSMDDMEFEVVGEEETVVSSVEDAAADIVSTEVETVEESSQPARPTQDLCRNRILPLYMPNLKVRFRRLYRFRNHLKQKLRMMKSS